MITLSPVELKKAQGNADHLAQLLVKKAVEEEIKLNPFSPEDKEKLEETKKKHRVGILSKCGSTC